MNFDRESAIAWAKSHLAFELSREIGNDDLNRSLTDLGLDSIDALMMISEMEEHFGMEYDAIVLLGYPTVAEMMEAAIAGA